MPTIPSYKLENDDLSAMDDLLLAKRKILNKMKIEDAEIKFDTLKNVDGKMILSNYDGTIKLLKSTINLFKQMDNRITLPPIAVGSSIMNESDKMVVELFDMIDKIKENFKILYNTIYDLLPFTRYIDIKRFDNSFKLVGELYNLILRFTTDKIEDAAGPKIVMTNRTKFTQNDFINKYSVISDVFLSYYNLWKQFINQYKAQEKVSVK